LQKSKNFSMKIKYSIFVVIAIIATFVYSCNSSKNNTENTDSSNDQDTSIFYTAKSHSKKVKKIFYTIPSPIELNKLLKKAGVIFDKSVMNPLSNDEHYLTIQKLAMNMGTYGTDVSYARIMDQIQISLDYIIVLKKISDKLGVPEEETKDIFERLEANINNRDSVLQLISQTYGNADSYFKDNDQGDIAALIIMGGWVEGMYIALNIAESAKDKDLIYRRIAEQKMSISNLVDLLKSYPNDTLLVKYTGDLEELRTEFDKINIVYKQKEIKTDTANHLTVISGESTVSINQEQLGKIKDLVTRIRENIIK